MSSAVVFPRSGRRKSGSYPNPRSPCSELSMTPSIFPVKTFSTPLGHSRAIAQTNLAVRSDMGTPSRFFRSFWLLAASAPSPFTPAYLADITPGSPPRKSTHNPLSSAITKQPLGAIFAAARAFISAFSENVLPSSSGGSNPLNSPAPNTSQSSLAFANISRNSDILCALEVAMQIFKRLIFPPRCNPACRREVLL